AVTVDSLADLVDAAIDSDRRVIHDTSDDTYHVIDDALRYEYVPDHVDDDADADGDVLETETDRAEMDAAKDGDTSESDASTAASE
ncbi:DUF5305 family protein, partial [Natronomonas sp.]|uniref:DUF5305 family protein n=1 Tax=Natronomonas sp. TaxID=2184060 RepID=UPI002FC2E09A